MRHEVLARIKELLELKGLLKEQDEVFEKARAEREAVRVRIEKMCSRPGDFGVGRNIQECFVKVDDQIVQVRWLPPALQSGDGHADLRVIRVEGR